jgi:hypothetical protein
MNDVKNNRYASNDQLESLVIKEDCKKACLQSGGHRRSSTLSLAELALISRCPVIIRIKKKHNYE